MKNNKTNKNKKGYLAAVVSQRFLIKVLDFDSFASPNTYIL